jgi:hypothetical protein
MTKKSRPATGAKSEAKPRKAPQAGTRAKKADQAANAPGEGHRRRQPAPRTREGSKQAKLIEMLRQPSGATIAEIVAAFSWQPHTVRGAIAGALKKKLGLAVTSEKVEGRGRVYRISE